MEIVQLSTWHSYICCQKKYFSALMHQVLNHLDEHIEQAVQVLKHDRTSTVAVVKIEGQAFVIKRANTKNLWHALRRCFAVSRAAKNWQNAQILLQNNLPTFEPVAYVEERLGFLKKRSYFIYPYLEGTLALNYFALQAKPQAHWPQVIRKIKNLLHHLIQQGVSHRDLNLSNIILINDQPWLIDLDAMRRFRITHRLQVAAKEQARFLENCQDATGILPQTVTLFREIFAE